MSKPKEEQQEQELSVDFFDEVEEVVDDEMALEDEDPKETDQEEEIEEVDDSEDPDLDALDDDEDDDGEEEEAPEGEDAEAEELPLVESIKQSLGYEFEEEFEDSEEGIQLLVERAKDKATQEAVNAYFDAYPDVKELLEYRQMGGDPDKFFQTKFPEVDYTKVELEEDNEKQLEQIVRQELTEVRGMSKEEVNAEIEDYRNGGILENKAKRSLSALKAKQQKDQESLIEQQREKEKQYQQQVEEHWNNVKKTLNESTELHGFKVPSNDKDKFFDYISKPVEEGKSQAMLDHEKAEMETRLAIDYLMFKGFDLSNIISRKAKDQNAKTLRQRMKQAKANKKREESSSNEFQELGEI